MFSARSTGSTSTLDGVVVVAADGEARSPHYHRVHVVVSGRVLGGEALDKGDGAASAWQVTGAD
jgi:hypothetical protein